MTFLKRISALVLALAVVLPAASQFSIGPRVGLSLNSIHFNDKAIDDVLNSSNHTGYTAGVQVEFTIPIINLGLDASVMYVHRGNDISLKSLDGIKSVDTSSDFIEIPVNLKYKIGLPVVGKILTPYIFTGPSFAFRTKEIKEFYNDQKCDISWNIGAGLQLFEHLQIGASYGFGLNDTLDKLGLLSDTISGVINLPEESGLAKSNCWTITAAWLF